MKNKIVGWILKVPLILLILASFFGGIYAAATNLQGISWSTPITLLIFIILYLVGNYLIKKSGE
jgi:intracellular septation protein A